MSAPDRTGTPARPLRVAVVGSGPAGFFAVGALLGVPHVEVDLYERLPTPFGLLRYGVAPDHPTVKQVARRFARAAAAPALRFIGNVAAGTDVAVDALDAAYDAVLWAHGAPGDKALGLPGEGLPQVWSSTAFTGFVNGHPDFAAATPDWSGVRRAVVIGNGNVALDCARLLLKDRAALAATDIAGPALRALRAAPVEEVTVLGRRGPPDASFTAAELRELLGLPGVAVSVEGLPEGGGAAAGPDTAASQLAAAAAHAPPPGARWLRFAFFEAPTAFSESPGGAEVLVHTQRTARGPDGRAVPGAPLPPRAAGLVVRAVGFEARPVPGLAWDAAARRVPSAGPQVLSGPGGAPRPGHFITGWARRGPTGVVGTNRADAEDAVTALLSAHLGQPARALAPRPGPALAAAGHRLVDWAAWERLDAAERGAGEAAGRPRDKLCTVEAMLDAAGV